MLDRSRTTRKKKRALAGMPVGEHHHAARLNETIVRRARAYKEEHDLCIGCIMKLLDLQPQQRQALYDAINYVTWKHVR